ncbi:hypothetical protein LWM68_13665 [Niabella sp. W65]|nr:hypothetical protein [Niabella sp. W65]MCH7363702.1 hypothetical protein [Niabella sp. W65]ULT39613.1 hypothetical protein KRR40_32485 [Niabella sp. I65]
MNLLFAIRTIQERTGKDLGATFLSGTTISNSLTELYLLFKYLRPQAMENRAFPALMPGQPFMPAKRQITSFRSLIISYQKNVSAFLSKYRSWRSSTRK